MRASTGLDKVICTFSAWGKVRHAGRLFCGWKAGLGILALRLVTLSKRLRKHRKMPRLCGLAAKQTPAHLLAAKRISPGSSL